MANSGIRGLEAGKDEVEVALSVRRRFCGNGDAL